MVRKNQLEDQYSLLKENMTDRNPNLFTRMFASGVLGGGVQVANLLTGSALGRALASPKVQRAAAGQLPTQKLIQELLPKVTPGVQGMMGAAGGQIGAESVRNSENPEFSY